MFIMTLEDPLNVIQKSFVFWFEIQPFFVTWNADDNN